MRRVSVALVALVALAGCAPTTPTPNRALGPGEQWLPVARWDGTLCAGGGFVGDFRIRGARDDPRLTWMQRPDGSRQDVAWPVGFSARFTPKLELLDEHGAVFAREGTHVDGGCATAEAGVMAVEFLSPAPTDAPRSDP